MSAHYCQNFKVVPVLNGYDKPIGGQCSRCLRVLYGIGDCAGDCGKKGVELRLNTKKRERREVK